MKLLFFLLSCLALGLLGIGSAAGQGSQLADQATLAIAKGTAWFAKSQNHYSEPDGLMLMDTLQRRFRFRVPGYPDMETAITVKPEWAASLKLFAGVYGGPTPPVADLAGKTADLTKMDNRSLACMYCNTLKPKDALVQAIANAANNGGYDLTHAGLQIHFLKEKKCLAHKKAEIDELHQQIAAGIRKLADTTSTETDLGVECLMVLEFMQRTELILDADISSLLKYQRKDGGWADGASAASNAHPSGMALWVLLAWQQRYIAGLLRADAPQQTALAFQAGLNYWAQHRQHAHPVLCMLYQMLAGGRREWFLAADKLCGDSWKENEMARIFCKLADPSCKYTAEEIKTFCNMSSGFQSMCVSLKALYCTHLNENPTDILKAAVAQADKGSDQLSDAWLALYWLKINGCLPASADIGPNTDVLKKQLQATYESKGIKNNGVIEAVAISQDCGLKGWDLPATVAAKLLAAQLPSGAWNEASEKENDKRGTIYALWLISSYYGKK